jgi:hypothetical protein
VFAEEPQVAWLRDGFFRQRRHLVGICQDRALESVEQLL